MQDYWNHSGVELEVLRPLEKLNLVTSNCPFTNGKWLATGAGKEEEFEFFFIWTFGIRFWMIVKLVASL